MKPEEIKHGQYVRVIGLDTSITPMMRWTPQQTVQVGEVVGPVTGYPVLNRITQNYDPVIKAWHGIIGNREHGPRGAIAGYVPLNAIVEVVSLEEYDKLDRETYAAAIKAGKIWFATGSGHCTTTGADPEIFAIDKDGIVIPAWEFLPAVDKKQTDYAPFYDGFQAEFNMIPGDCHAQRVDHVASQLLTIWKMAAFKFPGAQLTSRSVLDIPYEMMENASNAHAGLGCSPSKNIYGVPRLKVPNPRQLPFRFAGFHIHFQCEHDALIESRIKSMDQILGPISVSLLDGVDDPRRRQYYGKAGEYRLPKHGLEYRVLSSTSLGHPVLTHLMFDIARLAFRLPEGPYKDVWKMNDADVRIQHVINEYDVDEARAILKENDGAFTSILKSLYQVDRGNGLGIVDNLKAMILEGARHYLNVDDMTNSWQFKTQWPNHSKRANCSAATAELRRIPTDTASSLTILGQAQ